MMAGAGHDWIQFLVEGVVLGFVCVFGILANSVSSWVLLSSHELDLSQVFVKLLVTLMTYDSVFLFGLLNIFCFPQILDDFFRHQIYPSIVPYMLPVIQIALTGKKKY